MIKSEKDKLFDAIAEISKNTKRLYAIYGSIILYILLTALSINDRQIALNESIKLPLFNIGFPVTFFLYLSPLIALVSYMYFQLYLFKLRRLINETNISKEEEHDFYNKVYPWLLNFYDEKKKGFVTYCQKAIVFTYLWLSLPVVVFFTSIICVKKHNCILDIYIGIIIIISGYTIGKIKSIYDRLKDKLQPKTTLKYTIIIIFEIVFIFLFFFSFEGISIREHLPIIGNFPNLNLSYRNLIFEENQKYNTLYLQDLSKAHLEGADFSNSVLLRSNLEESYFKQAKFIQTQLDTSSMYNSSLDSTIFYGASLKKVNLEKSDIKRTYFNSADLTNANLNLCEIMSSSFYKTKLDSASFRNSILVNILFQDVDLSTVNFEGASLLHCQFKNVQNLSYESFIKCHTLFETKFEPTLFDSIKKYLETKIDVEPEELRKFNNKKKSKKSIDWSLCLKVSEIESDTCIGVLSGDAYKAYYRIYFDKEFNLDIIDSSNVDTTVGEQPDSYFRWQKMILDFVLSLSSL